MRSFTCSSVEINWNTLLHTWSFILAHGETTLKEHLGDFHLSGGFVPTFLTRNGLNHSQKTIQIHPGEPSFNCTAKAEFQPPKLGCFVGLGSPINWLLLLVGGYFIISTVQLKIGFYICFIISYPSIMKTAKNSASEMSKMTETGPPGNHK